jgi:ACS family glucarate transporter-like MFS transporter
MQPGVRADLHTATSTAGAGRRRYLIAVALCLISCLGYMDRVNFSVAGSHVITEFNLTTGDFGLATSVFNWAYLLLLVPVGILADRLNSRVMLATAVIIWSLGAGLTGLATGIGTLIVARLVLGAGESPNFPVGNLVVREWAPAKERGAFTGALNAGTVIGPAIGAVVAAYLVVSVGWRGSFLVLGGVGLVVGVVWVAIYRRPEHTAWLSAAERNLILKTRGTVGVEAAPSPMGIGRLLRTRAMWGLMLTQGTAVYTSYLFLSFLPLYLQSERGLAILKSGWVTGLIYAIAAVGSIAAAIVSDRLLRATDIARGGRRKAVAAVLLAALPLLALPWVTNIATLIALVSWVLILDTAAITLNWALASDLITDRASSARAFSLVALGGNVFGLLAPIVTGYLVDWTGDYTVPFIVAAVLLLGGAAATLFLSNQPMRWTPTASAEA